MVHAKGKKLDKWRADIRHAAKEVCKSPVPKKNPVNVTLVFRMKKAKSNKNEYPVTRPDLDKLIRAVLDALTGVCFDDDSQVMSLTAMKIYDGEPGVDIWVSDDPDVL